MRCIVQTSLHINAIAQTSGEHVHDYQQLMIGLSGRMDCELSTALAPLMRGSVGFLPQGARHRYAGRDADCRVLVLDYHLDDPFISALCQASGASAECLGLRAEANLSRPSAALIGLLDWNAAQGRFDRLQVPAVRNQLIASLLTEIVVGDSLPMRETLQRSRISLEALHAWVDAHLAEPIGVIDLAAAFCLSESHSFVAVKTLAGCSPMQFVTRRRMRLAIELLRGSSLRLEEIALRVGYAELSSFSKTFRRHVGVAPGSYRKETGATGVQIASE